MLPFLSLLAITPAANASSSIEFRVNGPVLIYIDGQQATLTGKMRQEAVGLDAGTHEVRVTGVFGKTLFEAEIDIPDNTMTWAEWSRGELRVLRTEWLDVASEPTPAEPTPDEAPVEAIAEAPVVPAEVADEVPVESMEMETTPAPDVTASEPSPEVVSEPVVATAPVAAAEAPVPVEPVAAAEPVPVVAPVPVEEPVAAVAPEPVAVPMAVEEPVAAVAPEPVPVAVAPVAPAVASEPEIDASVEPVAAVEAPTAVISGAMKEGAFEADPDSLPLAPAPAVEEMVPVRKLRVNAGDNTEVEVNINGQRLSISIDGSTVTISDTDGLDVSIKEDDTADDE